MGRRVQRLNLQSRVVSKLTKNCARIHLRYTHAPSLHRVQPRHSPIRSTSPRHLRVHNDQQVEAEITSAKRRGWVRGTSAGKGTTIGYRRRCAGYTVFCGTNHKRSAAWIRNQDEESPDAGSSGLVRITQRTYQENPANVVGVQFGREQRIR